MLDILVVILFCWLFFKCVGLAFRMAWGAAKILASLLVVVAVPLMILGAVFAGGLLLLIPLGLIGLAFGIVKACV